MSTINIPEHLTLLGGNDWFLWRWIALRSAGFPTFQVLALADTYCASLADKYIEEGSIFERERDKTIQLLLRKLKSCNDPIERASTRKDIQRLSKSYVRFDTLKLSDDIITSLREAGRQAEETKKKFSQAFQTTLKQNRQEIHNISCNLSFQEAVLWQNRNAFHNEIKPLNTLFDFDALSSRQRKRLAMVASYLSRYCMKNDTISFFGPVGWARVEEQEPGFILQIGKSLLAERNVYFELWGIDVLAQTISQNKALLPWCLPRRLPLVGVDGLSLHIPFAPPTRLASAHAAVLNNCNGEYTAKQLANMLVKDTGNYLDTESEVYDVLQLLNSMRRIEWALEISSESIRPERSLRHQLERIEDPILRQQALEPLNELEAKLNIIIQSRGDVEKLDYAFGDFEETFTRLTGIAATRRNGQTYGSRTLLYEDCRRDVTIKVSPKMIETLAPPLIMLLTSARWFTFKAAAIFRKVLNNIYLELTQKSGATVLNFSTMWVHLHSILFEEDNQLFRALERELQKRWYGILKFTAEQRNVQVGAKDIYEETLRMFDAPHPGWSVACYHSPDLMIEAKSLDAILEGDFRWILGELHMASNTLNSSVWVEQHPSSQDLFRALESDLPLPQVRLVASREDVSPRRTAALLKTSDYRFVVANDSCGIPFSQMLLAGSLVVEEIDGNLMVYSRNDEKRFEIIEFLGDVLSLAILHRFKFIPTMKHIPRISIDNLIIHRETWRFMPEDITFAFQKDDGERFILARRWALNHNIPRFLFVKTPVEEKPFYVDLCSPILIDLLAKAIRSARDSNKKDTSIEITEMLPAPENTWLVDNDGNKYTSEFRMVIVDKINSKIGGDSYDDEL